MARTKTETEHVLDARDFAVRAHKDQKYGSDPYAVHLDAVAALVSSLGPDWTRLKPRAVTELLIVAYLHDVVEDTDVAREDIESRFGETVAAAVDLLTDCPGKNRKERKAKTYARLAAVDEHSDWPGTLALVVKAADRLANMRACARDGNKSLMKMYIKEHVDFRRAAFRSELCDLLWDEIDDLVRRYR